MRPIMDYYLDEGAVEPTRAHPQDAGLDLYAMEDQAILEGCSASFDTGVHMLLPEGTYGKIEGKSGLNVRCGVVSLGGVIDEGYTGSVVVKLYNLGDKPYMIRKGDKIAQLIIMPCVKPVLRQVEGFAQTERGENGFGSSGR